MSRLRSVRPLAGAAAVCLLLAGCSSLEGTGDKGYVTGNGTVRLIDAADRDDAIALSGDDLDGEPLDVADFRGAPVVITVWGSWCTPCNSEAPDLVEADERLGDTAEFVGINVRDPSTAQALAFVRSFDVAYPSIYSPDGKALLEFSGTLTANSIPSTVVLDADGRVAASILGTIPSVQTLVDVVEDVAAEKAADG